MEGVGVAESFDYGEREGHGFAGAGAVSGNQIFAFENVLEALVLHGKEVLYAFVLQNLDHFFIFDEIAELALFREAVLFNLHRIRIEILQQLSPRLFKVTNTVLGITLSHC